jgi:glycosyltransferase involved in cell wall biosynthesis
LRNTPITPDTLQVRVSRPFVHRNTTDAGCRLDLDIPGSHALMADRRTRIVRVIARLNVGGPTRHVVWLTEALNNSEFETTLVTGVVPPGEDDMTDFAKQHHVAPLVIREMSREISPRDAITVWKFYRLLLTLRPDIVHTHTAKAGTIGRVAGLMYRFLTPSLLIGRPRRCRFIHTYHGHIFHSYYGPLKTRLFLAIEKALARLNTDRLLVLSEQQLREIRDTFGVGRPHQFAIVPLGIDIDAVRGNECARRDLRRELGIDEETPIIGIVGRIAAIKNHELFLRTAALFPRHAARFVIFGDGAERLALEKRAAEIGVADRVLFAGTREPASIYASLDITALTSRNEGTPLSLIESMANGRPIVSTAVGGVIDLLGAVEDSVTEGDIRYESRERGLTVGSGDAASLAAAIARLLRDTPLRERLGARGRVFVETFYSKDRLVADIARVSRELTV